MKSVQAVVLGITLCAASAAVFYKWYKDKKESCDKVDAAPRIKFKTKPKADKVTTVTTTIPNNTIPLIIGRGGANVKAIEERTGVKITFREKDEQNQLCEMNGVYENVMKAAKMIEDELKKSTSLTDEIIITKPAYEKICSQASKIMREICQKSYTQIRIDPGFSDKSLRRLLITGSFANVQKAKHMIEDQVRQDAKDREVETKREPRYNQKNSPINSSMESLSKQSSSPTPSAGLLSNIENFSRMPNKFGGQMEVYVSAVASPARFLVQMVGPQINKLEDLITEMTEYYDQSENQQKHRIKDPYLGQIVAARFQYDNKWYRAEIVGIAPNEYDPRKVALDLYFLDYGDSIYVNPHEVFELRTDFLTLRYQAIECFLANVQPVHPLEGGQWSHEAINKFEELTHVAKWKKLTARTVKTKERFRSGELSPHESSTIPGIELYDNIDDREVNLASILILENFAVPANQDEAATPLSRYSSSDNVLRLDGGSTSSGSVAEKAMMFELTANLQNKSSPSAKSVSSNGSKSPFSTTPKRNRAAKNSHKENNGNIQNVQNATDDKLNNTNFQDLLAQQLLSNRSWGEIMEGEL